MSKGKETGTQLSLRKALQATGITAGAFLLGRFTSRAAPAPVEVISGSETNSGSIFMADRPEYFTYDLDGNMVSGSRWNYTWDAENRLTSMTDNTTCTNDVPKRIVFEYDYQGRRIAKKVWNNTAGTGTPATYLKYLYDGWNLIAELNGNSGNVLVRSYTWGLDASGSMQGAGGVGGLLMVNAGSGGVHFPAYDLNGNVMGLVNAANGNISAKYEYGPFGEVFCSVGDMAKVNPFQFSTKYTDNETDLLYYGYRYYSPALGRWLSRDPIEEQGGLSLYGFVDNDPVNAYDILGLWKIERKGESRAMAYAEDGDTIKRLARIIRLNPEEYRLWLKPEKIYTKPYDEDTKLTKCDSFSIPNTAYIDVSAYTYTFMGVRLNAYRMNLERSWSKKGYNVDYSYHTVIKEMILAHLSDPDIYTYAYIGHGGSGILVISKQTWVRETVANTINYFIPGWYDHDTIVPGKYTPFGIAEMRLIGCETNMSDWQWKENVSRNGTLITINGKAVLWNIDIVTDIFKDE